MKILAFESSCDETAVAVVEDGRRVLSDAIASQADMHALYGGVVPEIASRKHVEAIAALTDKALADAGVTKRDIDAVAVTYAPGLIGAVLVGLSFAKSVAYALGVPLIPVHHIRGHIAANYLAFPESFAQCHCRYDRILISCMCSDQATIALFKSENILAFSCRLKSQNLLPYILKSRQNFNQSEVVSLCNGVSHIACNNRFDQAAVIRQSLKGLSLADLILCQKTP